MKAILLAILLAIPGCPDLCDYCEGKRAREKAESPADRAHRIERRPILAPPLPALRALKSILLR